MTSPKEKPSILLFFPAYNDEGTIRIVTEKSLAVLAKVASDYKVLIVNDGSPDKSGEIADQLARENPKVSVVHHPRNLGYGAALQSGFNYSRDYDWICFTDGDDQYDVNELEHMATLLHRYDMLITFRYEKIYSTWRLFVSAFYNMTLRFLFRSPFRDISCGLKLVRCEVIDNVKVTASSPFVGAEVTLKAMLKGYVIGEVGISTYPRDFGRSTATSWKNIFATIKDMMRVHREIFTNRPRPKKP